MTARAFDPDCRRCGRLVAFLEQVKRAHPDYHCAPVASFGAADPRLLVVGLAPGMHGANATGRPFTGDHAGILLYATLHRFGFATAPASLSADDRLALIDCRISNAVRCLPPENKPVGEEIKHCRDYLQAELVELDAGSVIIALGSIAHKSIVAAFGLRQTQHPFAHAAEHTMPGPVTLIDSYHCSRYNTQTRRLTTPMFERVFERARSLLG